MTAFSFSYAPKASTALASINPIQNRGEGLRFAANTPMSFLQQNPEVVTEGFWKGRQALTEGVVKGVTSALSGVTGALTSKAQEAKATADSKLEHDRAIEIAKIKAAPTAAETAYQQQRSDLLTQQIAAAKAKNENAVEVEENSPLEPGTTDFSQFLNLPDFKTRVQEVPASSAAPAAAPAAPASVTPATPATPAPAGVSQKSIFGQSENPNFVAFRDAIKNQSTAAVTPTEPNLFSDISAVTPAPVQEGAGYSLANVQLPQQQQYQLPESAGQITLDGKELPLMPVSGAEAKPLAGTPPVEPALPQAEPALAATPEPTQPTQLSETEYKFQIENQLTARPYKSPAEANMAKRILEQKLGVKVKIDAVKGDKGSKLYYVEVTEEAPSPMESVPKDMVMKQVTDKDGNLTTTYLPKPPIKQQVATLDNNIEKARVLKATIEKIEKIAPGYLGAGAGGISGIMQYNPFSNDARTVRKLVDTVKGIVGFDELVALKAAGGSLGALSDSELSMLTSLKGSVDPDLDEATFLANIGSIKESANKLINGLESDKKELMTVEKPTNFQSIQSSENRVQIKTQAEFDALKSGQKFIFNGRPGTK
jgi:hypothetical protein